MSNAAKKASQRKGSVGSSETCKACGELDNKDGKSSEIKWVQCDICDGWCHITCAGLEDRDFDFLMKAKKANKCIFWVCNDCNQTLKETKKAIDELKDKYDKLEKGMTQLQSDKIKAECGMESLRSNLDKEFVRLNTDLQAQISATNNRVDQLAESVSKLAANEQNPEEKKTLWSDMVKQHVDERLGLVDNNIEEVRQTLQDTREQAAEEREKEKRKNNILIYRMPESTANSADGRRKDDHDFLFHLFQDILEIHCEEDDIDKIIRLGRRQDENDRPVLVEFKNRTTKNQIMESLSKLKPAEERFRRLSITHDMTLRERVQCKQLVSQAKDQEREEGQGEWIYRVRGPPSEMKIIRLRRRH